MDLELGEDQRLIQDSVRKFALAEVRPGAKDRDHHQRTATDLFPRLEELGLFDLASLGLPTAVIALEELARQDASLAFEVAAKNYADPVHVQVQVQVQVPNVLGLRSARPVELTTASMTIAVGAIAVGLARAALEDAIAYANERKQFGKPIADFQAIQWMLADMATETDAARMLVHLAAHQPLEAAAEKARVYACEHAVSIAMKAIQIHGGIGFTRELPVERCCRDAKQLEIFAGGSDRMRTEIARSVLVG